MKTTLIKNGYVVDPKQRISRKTNIIIRDGAIERLTDEDYDADMIINAEGMIVTPGFIDMHMHEDIYDKEKNEIKKSMSTSALKMGVTLDIAGNCGDNVCDPDIFLDTTDRDGAPVNIAMLVGHTYLRNRHGKRDKYKNINQYDIDRMADECNYFLQSGCIGVSYGLKYVPGTSWDEIMRLVNLCSSYDKLVSSHVRKDVDGVFEATEELARMSKEGQVKVEFSHIGSMGGYGQMPRLLEMIKGYREEGIDIMCDCYPYDSFSTGIGETTYDEGFLERYNSDYSSILIVNGEYSGQRCTETIYHKLRDTAPDTGTVGFFMKPEDIEIALKSPYTMIGSDGVRNDGLGHPRASGTFARFIHDYIRTGKISLEDGVAKMTTMAAERLGLDKKGNFLPGSDGDITIFDINEVQDMATYENGQIAPKGIKLVIIAGEIALRDGEVVNGHLGKSVRK